MNTDDVTTGQQTGADIADLKKSGVEILGGEEVSETPIQTIPEQTPETAQQLEHEFEVELGTAPAAPHTTSGGLAESLEHLENVKVKLAQKEKMLEDETQRDIEALKKTKAMIEEKIKRLKEIEQKEKLIDTEIKEVKDLDARVQKVAEDVKQIEKDVL